MELQGIQPGELEVVQTNVMDKIVYQATKGWIIYVCNKEGSSVTNENETNPFLQKVCEEFADIFSKLPGLPPHRDHDHQIPLMNDAEPVNLRPYRHPWK